MDLARGLLRQDPSLLPLGKPTPPGCPVDGPVSTGTLNNGPEEAGHWGSCSAVPVGTQRPLCGFESPASVTS